MVENIPLQLKKTKKLREIVFENHGFSDTRGLVHELIPDKPIINKERHLAFS